MKTILLAALVMFPSIKIFADFEAVLPPMSGSPDERVVTEARRLYSSRGQQGVIFTSVGGNPSGSSATAAGALEPIGDSSGISDITNPPMTEAQKKQKNNESMIKAKENPYVKAIVDGLQKALDWSSKFKSGTFHHVEIELANGNKCKETAIAIGTDEPKMLCTEVFQSGQKVVLPNGQVTDQLNLYIKVKDRCYYVGNCRETTFEFVADSKEEMDAILSEILAG